MSLVFRFPRVSLVISGERAFAPGLRSFGVPGPSTNKTLIWSLKGGPWSGFLFVLQPDFKNVRRKE